MRNDVSDDGRNGLCEQTPLRLLACSEGIPPVPTSLAFPHHGSNARVDWPSENWPMQAASASQIKGNTTTEKTRRSSSSPRTRSSSDRVVPAHSTYIAPKTTQRCPPEESMSSTASIYLFPYRFSGSMEIEVRYC